MTGFVEGKIKQCGNISKVKHVAERNIDETD